MSESCDTGSNDESSDAGHFRWKTAAKMWWSPDFNFWSKISSWKYSAWYKLLIEHMDLWNLSRDITSTKLGRFYQSLDGYGRTSSRSPRIGTFQKISSTDQVGRTISDRNSVTELSYLNGSKMAGIRP